MNKNRISLTESNLHKIIKDSVNRVLKESTEDEVSKIKEAFNAIMGIKKIIDMGSACFHGALVAESEYELVRAVGDAMYRWQTSRQSYQKDRERWQHEQD